MSEATPSGRKTVTSHHVKLTLVAALVWYVVLTGANCYSTSLPVTSTLTKAEPSVAQAIQRVSPAVVYIVADDGAEKSAGTGIIIDSEGYILTNNHIVEKSERALVRFPGKQEVLAEIVYRDKSLDLAILKCPGSNYSAVAVGSIEEPTLGEDVIAMGFPSVSAVGTSPSISKGIVSALRTIDGVKCIQTDAALNPGSSGGPLINMNGEVIGINSWRLREGEGMNFAIALNREVKRHIDSVVAQLIDGRLSFLKPPAERTE